MLSVVTLPVVVAFSSMVPAQGIEAAARTVAQKASRPAPQVDTITCPLTGQEIPSCCCPVKK